MKCSSCIGGGRRSLSSSDHESASPVNDGATADREAPAPPSSMAGDSERRDLSTLHRLDGSDNAPTADDSEDGRPPSITIEELDDDVFEGYAEDARMMVIRHHNEREEQQEEELMNPTSVSYAHLLIAPSRRAPLEVIREEELDVDCSDGEFSHRSPTTTEPSANKRDDPPPKQDVPDGGSTVASGDAVAHGLAWFSPAKVLRDILRYRTRRRRGNRKQQPKRHQERQEQTTCVLVDAKEADIAPQEYRSVCTTETVSCEMLEVEVINIGSNSSSLDDLSDVDADTAGQQLHEEETVPAEKYGKLELDHTEHTADSGVLEKRPQTVHQLADDGSRQLEHESIKTQMIPDAQVLEINPRGKNGASSDTSCSSSSSYQLDNTHHNSCCLAADHDLHQTEENDLNTQTPRCDDLHVERPTADGSWSEAAPAHPVVSAGSSQNLDDDDDGDDDDDDDAAGDGGDRQERNGSERTGDNDTNGNKPESDSGRSPATPEAADTGGALLGISSSGVASVDRDRASVVGVDVGVDGGDDASVPKVSLKNPPPSEFDRAASHGVGSRVNHCARYEEGPPPPPGATTMSIEDESVSAVAVGKKGHRPPPLPPVPAPRVAAIPLPPPPTDGGASTGVTQLGRSQPVGGNEEATQQEVLEPTRGSVAPPPPPPPAAYHLVPLTVEALSSGASSPTSLQNGQIHTGGHTDQTDHADPDQGSAQDSVDAVGAPAVSDPDRTAVIEQVAPAECENDQSVLLKYMQEDDSVSGRTNSRSETLKSSDQVNDGRIADDFDEHRSKRTTGQPTAPSIRSDPGESSREGRGPKIEPSGGSRRGGQYLCDGFDAAVVRRPQASRNLDPVQAGGAGMGVAEPAERNRLPDTKTSTGGKQSSSSSSSSSSGPQLSATPEQNAALVADLRTEISRLKDAELQEEFLKLELETARYERELQQITVPSRESKASGGGVAGRSSLDSRTYIVSKQKDFVVERSPNGAAGLPRMTGGKLRGNGPAPTVTGTTYAAADNQLYTEWQQKMEQREERRVQRTASTEQRDDPASTPLARSSIPPPPPPTDADEEIFSKKVKDRVRDLMAAQAAAAEEARGTLRGRAIASAPSTPTAGRKHIEAEFREFREIRQREVVAEKATLATESAKENERQLVQAVHNHAPSRIPLATSSSKKVPAVQRATPAPPPKAATVSDESGLASAEEIKVNVAALIATHQEKQQLQQVAQPVAPAQPPKGTPSRQHQDVVSGPNGASSAPAEVQEQMQQDEPSVSVSDKCQQFEQRIRRNSESGKGDSTIATVCRKPTGTTGHQQARAGTTLGSYGDACCATTERAFCSEADLLHEIDHALVLAKDFLFSRDTGSTLKLGPKYKAKSSGPGVWSPFNRSTEILTKEELAERSSSSSRGKPTELQQPVWTPRSAPPSPATERREFRPIGFESPTPTRRVLTPSPAATSASVAAPWTQPGYNPPLAVSSEPKTIPRTTSLQTSASNPTIGGTPQRTTLSAATPPPPGQQYQVRFAPQQRSNSNEPTINSLLKSKDGKTASVGVADSTERLQKSSTTTSSTSGNRSMSSSSTTTTTTTYQQQQQQQSGNSSVKRLVSPGPRIGPSIDQPDSTAQVTQNSNMQQTAHHKVDGIGPITREGMPLTLRSEIDEGNRDKWYKQMYHTLHKAHDDDDYVTVRYKTRRGYPYKSSGYQSEPEPNYDSDYTIKYSTLDRRRIPLDLSPASYSKFNTLQSNPSPPQHFHQPSAKAGLASYRNQPGRIENYTPGRSSISEKESKEWWDEVMDIFNGQLEHQKLTTSKTYTEGNLSRALKEQGYESDSTLVFRKREPPSSAALSPVEQKQHYKTMQAGGEIPLHGFRKPAPEKPKDPTGEALDVRVEISEGGGTNPFLPRGGATGEEIVCYPITSISRPLDMFGPFPRETRTFVPPVPPSRKSSRSNSTLKIMSQVKTNTYDRRTVLERTTVATGGGQQQHAKFRSKSAGPPFFVTSSASSASMMKEEKNQENSTRVASSKRYSTYRVSSTSPTGSGGGGGMGGGTSAQSHQRKASPSPVAFGRGISKERTFAEEKKRIEEKLPKVVSVSTSILRNPELKSPNEVKKALRSSYLPIVGSTSSVGPSDRSSLRRFPSNGTFRSASSIYSSSKSLNSRVMSPAAGVAPSKSSYKVTVVQGKRPSSPREHHQHQLVKKSAHRKANHHPVRPTVTIKSSFQKASKAFGLKTKAPSSQSLARTSSTYSLDSTNSTKRKSRICYIPITTESKGVASRTSPKGPRQRVFAGSLDRGLRSHRRVSGTPATVQEERYSERTVRQQAGNVRTDSFFQNLFLKGPAPEPTDRTEGSGVLEKARQWNSLSCRSEPTLKQPNYYLTQARPVSSSKFKSLDQREAGADGGQTLPTSRSFGGEVFEQVNRFEALVNEALDDDEDEQQQQQQQQFGYVRGRRMKIDYSFHERSRSEPSANTMTTTTTTTTKSTVIQEELISTNSPRTIVGRRCAVAQRSSRSPSCRRIQYLKGKEGQVKRIVRARSLSSEKATQRTPRDALVRSHSLNLNHEQGASGVSRSRFRDLHTFYNSLERLGQLERVTSSSSGDLRPARRTRDEEIIDFDLWKRVRDHEKAERELCQLKHRLKVDQREKDLFFLPRDPDEVRWRSDLDTGLRNREKSIDDLKCLLSRQPLHFEGVKLRELAVRKDHYKPLWRGSSVIDVASQLEEKYSGEKRGDEPQSLDVISSNLLSTLSSEQMRKLKNQLSEIYSGASNGGGGGGGGGAGGQKRQPITVAHEESHAEEYIINVPERASRLESLLKVRSNSVLTADQINPGQLRCQLRKPEANVDPGKATVVASVQKTLTERAPLPAKEFDRATLSRTLCQELKDKMLEKHHTLPSVGKKKRDARPTILPTAAMDDHRFLSLESGLRKMEREKAHGEGHKAQLKEEGARKERPHTYCDTESMSSETSNKTVIFRSGQLPQEQVDAAAAAAAAAAAELVAEDIRSKIKYFEEKHTAEETPTVTVYHARDDSSPSEDEITANATDEARGNGGQHERGEPRHGSTLTLSQSFTDLKDLFGEKRSAPCRVYTGAPSSGVPPRSVSPKHFTFRSRSTTPDYATCIQTGEVKKIKERFESLDGSLLRRESVGDTATAISGGDRPYQSDSELNQGSSEQGNRPGATIVRHHEAGDVTRMTHRYEVQAAGRARSRRSRKERVISPIPKNPFRKDDRFMPHINVISKTASLKREIKPTRTPTQTAKTILLQSSQLPNVEPQQRRGHPTRRSASSGSEEFEKLKSKFETGCGGGDVGGAVASDTNLSLLGKMYTSVPDVRELKDIPGYLSGAWIAHQFPKPTDNARSLTAPERSPPGKQVVRKGSRPASPNHHNPPPHHHHQHHQHHQQHHQQHHHPSLRSHSSSPPRQRDAKLHEHSRSSSSDAAAAAAAAAVTYLRQFYTNDNQDDLLEQKQKTSAKGERFVSNQQLEAEALWRKIQLMTGHGTAAGSETAVAVTVAGRPTVTFEEPHIQFPSPPMKGAQAPPPPPTPPPPPPLTSSPFGAESPRRYIESDVNIHYKTPIRFEYKEPIPDDELAYRQAEHMRRVYQEERRRKYINELEDMHSRRHTDNIPPSQKSPIPLNRYDDFAADLSPVPQHVVKQPKTIARALYNFQGQSIRELSFRKGDIIHLRRQVDKNWYEGEHNANVGLLPANYIEILSRDTANAKPLPKKPAREGKARAKFNFTAQTGVELSLLKGELVTLTRRVDDNWFEGKIGSKKGIFPVSYVEILTDINGEESYDIEPIVNRPQSAHGVTSQPSQTLTTHYGTSHTNGRVSPGILRETKTVQKTEVLHVDTSNEPISYRALYNYKPQNSDELELLEGDVVYVLEKCDDGWYVGTSARTGCFGTFPGNYVSKM